MSQEKFSFQIAANNQERRTLCALDKEFRDLAGGRASLSFPDVDPKAASAMGTDNWDMAPQPDGVWIHGSGVPPRGLIKVLREFVRRHPRQISFTYSSSPDQTKLGHIGGGAVVINERGCRILSPAEATEMLLKSAMGSIRVPDDPVMPIGDLELYRRDLDEVQNIAGQAILELTTREPFAFLNAIKGLHGSFLKQIILDAESVLENREENSSFNPF